MVNTKINDVPLQVEEGTTILDAAAQANMPVPSLCYLKDINEIGACRVCSVEVRGVDRLVTACNNTVSEGMEILTNSPRVREARRINAQLILSQHDCHCPTCTRSGNCNLQKLAGELGLFQLDYAPNYPKFNWPASFPLIREDSKCIKCMRCVQICDKIQDLHVWDVSKTGSRTTVGVSHNRSITEAECSLCGQCITHCPTGALRSRDDTGRLLSRTGAFADPEKVTIVQVAPAVRTAWGEQLGLDRDFATPERLVSALKAMGFTYVFDTDFGADLTIMEEGSEFLERFTHRNQYRWPMFTSCCPGWVRFIKGQFPAWTDHLSTAKSPQQMFGAIAKSYFAEKIGVDPHKMCVISVMPCISKKAERELPTMRDACGDPDVDVVLTTRELSRLLRSEHILPQDLPEENFDSPLGSGSGAAVIFGATGGVMDAALRSAYYLVTGKNPDPDAFTAVRGIQPWKEAAFTIPGAGEVRVAVVSGLGNTRRLMEALEKDQVSYDFVEVMACPGGCAGGGGQPIHEGMELAGARGDRLWQLDAASGIRFSHENPDIQVLYRDYLGQPLGERSHHLLHTDHTAWQLPTAPDAANN